MRLRSAVVLGIMLTIAAAGCGREAPKPAAHGPTDPPVPYITTPPEVVDAMLALGGVTKTDVLYDLGSGDGRIVVEAARKLGARGVGIEIDPALVEAAKTNARQAGVADRATFLAQDLFDTDLREATVVTLYLLPEINIQLRPKLMRELRPGSRIVSHQWDMGPWAPDKTVQIGDHKLYLWVIPK